MKQSINLYQQQFRVRRDWKRTAVIGGIAALVLLLAGTNVYQVYSLNTLEDTLTAKNGELESMNQSYTALAQRAKPKVKDMNLVAQLERVKRSNAEKLRALNYLSGNDAGNLTGFSFLMEGLGRNRDAINDLWLSNIQFSSGGFDMRLRGSSYSAELLPKFIQELGNEEIYKDREFREIRIRRSENNSKVMNFVLDTQHTEGGSEQNDPSSMALFMARLRQLSQPESVTR